MLSVDKYFDYYDNERTAYQKALEILYRYKFSKLPIDISRLCSLMGIRLGSYKTSENLIVSLRLENFMINDGFTAIINNSYYIFYNSDITERRRFTVSHELGHIAMGHLETENLACMGGVTVWNRSDKAEPSDQERFANIFASTLLAPDCVLYDTNINTQKKIIEVTGLTSEESGRKLIQLNNFNNNHSITFLEKAVNYNFRDFIQSFK